MRVIIDRFEGEFAICEKPNRKMIYIKRHLIPPEAQEGDVLECIGDYVVIDKEETEERRKEVSSLMNELLE